MAGRGFKTVPVEYLIAVPPNICILQATNDSADMKSARQGHFQEKEENSNY